MTDLDEQAPEIETEDGDTPSRHPAKALDLPSFSIVIPTYQRREVVCDAVRALAAVKYSGAVELIVVVDGSTDDTEEALKRIACPFPVHIVVQANAGAAAARNRGAADARNEVILFLDDDMMSDVHLLREHARMYADGADAVIGSTPIDPRSPAGFLPQSVARWIDSTRVQSPISPFDVFSGQLSVRRSLLERLGGFDVAFTSGQVFGSEDADLGVRLLAQGDVRHNPSAVSLQRYVVEPDEYDRRVERNVAAHLQFIAKHPQLSRDLFERRALHGPLVRWVYRPLSAVPALSELIRRLAVGAARLGSRTRLRSSRLLARLFSGACSLTYWTELRRRGWYPFSDRLLTLCYHAIDDLKDDPVLGTYSIDRLRFERQIDALTARGYTFISPAHLAAFLDGKAVLPRRPVLLTFDDGYAELPAIARDILQPRGIAALAFVVTGVATNAWDQPFGARPLGLLTRHQLWELAGLGVAIGSHSRTHGEMQKMDAPGLDAEALGSLADIESGGLPRPSFFAYPYGAKNDAAAHAVRRAGYLGAFGLRQARLRRSDDRYDLPRVIVLAEDGAWRFRFKTAAPILYNLFFRARRKLRAIIR